MKSVPSTLREVPLSSQLYVWSHLLPFRELPNSNLKYGAFCVLVWRWRALEMSCILSPTEKRHFIDLDQREQNHLLFTEEELTFKQPIFQIKTHGYTRLFKRCCWHTLTLTLGVNYTGLRLKIWGTKTAENLSGSYGGCHNVLHRYRWHHIDLPSYFWASDYTLKCHIGEELTSAGQQSFHIYKRIDRFDLTPVSLSTLLSEKVVFL